MWSIGTIIAEMVTKRPLFSGDSEIDEIFKIFRFQIIISLFHHLQPKFILTRVLGTPNEETWPGVTCLQDWNESFPIWPSLNIARLFLPGFTADGIDLVEVRIILD